jgi:hypothetical protein
VATRSKAWHVFARSNTGIVGWNPTRGMDVCVRLFCVCVVLCVGSGLATGWSPVQEVLPTVCTSRNWKSGQGPTKGCTAIDRTTCSSRQVILHISRTSVPLCLWSSEKQYWNCIRAPISMRRKYTKWSEHHVIYTTQSSMQLRGFWLKHPLLHVFLQSKHVSVARGPSSGIYDPRKLLHCV